MDNLVAYLDSKEEQIEFESFTYYPLLFLKMIFFNFQPLNADSTKIVKFNHYLRKFLHWFSMFSCFFIAFQVSAYSFFNSDDADSVLRGISDASTSLLMAFKGLTIFLRKDTIWTMLLDLKAFFEYRRNENKNFKMKSYLDEFLRIVKMYAAIFISGNLIVAIPWLPYFLGLKAEFVARFWFPFDSHQPEIFPFALMWMDVGAYMLLSFLVSSDVLLYMLVSVLSMEYDLLKHDLMKAKFELKREQRNKVRRIIDSHNKLNEFSDKLQKIFEPTFLFSFTISSLNMCVLSVQILFGKMDILMYMFTIACLAITACQIWLLCYYGQKLVDSSVDVADGIFGSDWTDLEDAEFKKDIIMIIRQAQRSKHLTAMGFADINLENFATVTIFDFLIEY